MRFSDAFVADRAWVSDGDFVVTCTCGQEQRLDAMMLDEGSDLTVYDCVRCENSLVGVMSDNAATDLWMSVSAMTRSHGSQGHRITASSWARRSTSRCNRPAPAWMTPSCCSGRRTSSSRCATCSSGSRHIWRRRAWDACANPTTSIRRRAR